MFKLILTAASLSLLLTSHPVFAWPAGFTEEKVTVLPNQPFSLSIFITASSEHADREITEYSWEDLTCREYIDGPHPEPLCAGENPADGVLGVFCWNVYHNTSEARALERPYYGNGGGAGTWIRTGTTLTFPDAITFEPNSRTPELELGLYTYHLLFSTADGSESIANITIEVVDKLPLPECTGLRHKHQDHYHPEDKVKPIIEAEPLRHRHARWCR